MRTLEEVLNDLKAAEKEYADKCLEYGIQEKKRKKTSDVTGSESSENVAENSQEQVSEVTSEETK